MPPVRGTIAGMSRLVLALLLAAVVALAACGTSSDAHRGRVRLVEAEATPDDFVIPRASLERALARGPSWFVQQVAVKPIVAGGAFYGYMLLALFPDAPDYEDRVLKPGDIVQRVNGSPIERPDQFMKVWESLRDASHLSVHIVRDRQPLLVTWAIR